MNSVTIRRRVQWIDTDAAGIWHHSLAVRWAEEAEAELHRTLGVVEETFGATPRVRTEFNFSDSLHFDDEVDITITIADLGATSVTYAIEVVFDSKPVITGRLIAVLIDRDTGKKRIWPDHLRAALSPG